MAENHHRIAKRDVGACIVCARCVRVSLYLVWVVKGGDGIRCIVSDFRPREARNKCTLAYGSPVAGAVGWGLVVAPRLAVTDLAKQPGFLLQTRSIQGQDWVTYKPAAADCDALFTGVGHVTRVV